MRNRCFYYHDSIGKLTSVALTRCRWFYQIEGRTPGWILCFVLIFVSGPSIAAEFQTSIDGKLLTGPELPSTWKLPTNVIDTTTLPKFSLDAEASDTAILPVYRLTPDTYFLFGNIATLDENNRGWNGNAGFVVTGDGVVAIDALGTPKLGRRMIATIRHYTDQPIKYLFVTHNHPDHAYGAAAFQALDGITVIAHQGTKAYNNSTTLEQSVAYRKELLPADMKGFTAVDANIYIGGDRFSSHKIQLGHKTFSIYNTGRHHSYGDLVIHQQPDNIVWISDLAFNLRTTYMGDGNSKQILQAQQWLMDNFSGARLMVPGHGGPQTKPFPMVQKTRNYVKKLRHDMLQAVENGVSLYDAVQDTEFPEWKGTRLYEENHRANANFVYREMEQEFFDNF